MFFCFSIDEELYVIYLSAGRLRNPSNFCFNWKVKILLLEQVAVDLSKFCHVNKVNTQVLLRINTFLIFLLLVVFSNMLKDTQLHLLADSDEREIVQQVQVIISSFPHSTSLNEQHSYLRSTNDKKKA